MKRNQHDEHWERKNASMHTHTAGQTICPVRNTNKTRIHASHWTHDVRLPSHRCIRISTQVRLRAKKSIIFFLLSSSCGCSTSQIYEKFNEIPDCMKFQYVKIAIVVNRYFNIQFDCISIRRSEDFFVVFFFFWQLMSFVVTLSFSCCRFIQFRFNCWNE